MTPRHPLPMPEHLAPQVWWGDTLGQTAVSAWPSGHARLDAHLPGGGWPRQAMTEVLQPPGLAAEWRLLAPALSALVARGASVLMIGPQHEPHLPGLAQWGLPPERVVWVHPATHTQRLWATEQALKADSLTAVLSWLPQAQPEQLRRLQTCAARHQGLLFVFRPLSAASASSPAPLRLSLALDAEQADLQVRLLKRRGTTLHDSIPVQVPVAWRRLWGPPSGVDAPATWPAVPSVSTTPASLPQEAAHGPLDRLVAG